MAELKRLFSSLENAELAYRAQIDEDSSILNQLHALRAHSHIVKHKYLTTMKDTFAANLARYRDEDLRVRSANLISTTWRHEILIIIICLCAILCIAVLAIGIWYRARKKRSKSNESKISQDSIIEDNIYIGDPPDIQPNHSLDNHGEGSTLLGITCDSNIDSSNVSERTEAPFIQTTDEALAASETQYLPLENGFVGRLVP